MIADAKFVGIFEQSLITSMTPQTHEFAADGNVPSPGLELSKILKSKY